MGNLSQPVLLLAVAADARGDLPTAIRYLELAVRMRPDPQLKSALQQERQRMITGQVPPIQRP